MLVAIYPIHKINAIKRIVVSTYQSASGAGARAMQELKDQTAALLKGVAIKKEIFHHQIAFNLFSHNSAIKEDGYNEEEIKMIRETQKIFHNPKIKVCATTVRVPILRAHSEAINLELTQKPDLAKIRNVLNKAQGVKVVDDRSKNLFPMPIDATDQDDVLVGRLREDVSHKNGLCLFVSGDQLRKGAALNAIQIAERLLNIS